MNKKIIGTVIITAISASLCCITPVLAIISGTTGVVSTFSWIEPYRPYFIFLTIAILSYAWFQNLKRKKAIECDCLNEKKSFLQSRTFLVFITLFSILSLTYPNYKNYFIPKRGQKTIVVNNSNVQKINYTVKGMSCVSCENEVKHQLDLLPGVIYSNVSYVKGNVEVEFDNTLVNISKVENAINKTGYLINKKIN